MNVTPPPRAEDLPRRLLVLLAVAFAVLALAAACGRDRSATPAAGRPSGVRTVASAPPATGYRHFVAYTATGTPALRVARSAAGTCFTASAAAPSAHAYRCFAANTILDPCFVPPSRPGAKEVAPTRLLCVANPWSPAVRLVLRSAPKGVVTGAGPARPWALELQGGRRCVAATGTVPSVDGHDLPYRCADGSSAALPRANLTAASRTTVLAFHARPGARVVTRIAVRTVWRV